MFGKEEMGFEDPNSYNLGLMAAAGWQTPVAKREWFIDIDVISTDLFYGIGIRVFGAWVSLAFVVGKDTI